MNTDLEAIKARAEAATPGPWRVKADGGGYDFHGFPTQTSIVTEEWPGGGWSRYGFNPADAEFIAHARTDVPALVAKVERLRAALERAPEDWLKGDDEAWFALTGEVLA